MKIAGLTGGIGSGKSTVARMLEKRGARVIDADRLAREVVEPGKPAWREILREFGEEALNPDRTLNREALAKIVFADPEKRELLNRITHPRVGEEIARLLKQYQEEGADLVVIDVPLLFESKATAWIRPVIVVVADDEKKIERVMKRDGCSREEVERRLAAQWPDEEKAKRADFVIDNSRDLASLERQVEEVWRKLVSGTGSPGSGSETR